MLGMVQIFINQKHCSFANIVLALLASQILCLCLASVKVLCNCLSLQPPSYAHTGISKSCTSAALVSHHVPKLGTFLSSIQKCKGTLFCHSSSGFCCVCCGVLRGVLDSNSQK